MEDKSGKISELIVSFLRQSLEDTTKQELDTWCAKAQMNQTKFDELTDVDYVSEHVKKFNSYSLSNSWEKISGELGLDNSNHIEPPKVDFKKRNYAIAATVALLVLAGSILYFYSNKSSASTDATATKELMPTHGKSHYNNEVLPGTSQASLTLADGKIIYLNSVADGLLYEKNGLVIRKSAEGKLEYDGNIQPEGGQLSFNTLTTPAGGQFQIKLPDGSNVWLNAATVIKFPTQFSGPNRSIELSGEAYFEVAKQEIGGKRVPFKVKTDNNVEVEVLGTHFNVSAYKNESKVKTTLLEGQVKIIKNKKSSILKPGQQAEIGKTDVISVIEPSTTAGAIAWKQGDFHFENTDIRDVMTQLARWYNVEVAFEGDMSNIHFNATMSRYLELTKILDILQLTGEVHFSVNGHKVTVYPH